MIFRPRDDPLEPAELYNAASGWVTFLVPPGLSYIAVAGYAAVGREGQSLAATPYPDHISVEYSAEQAAAGTWVLDFIDTPRFAVQVSQPQTLIYAGTIVRNTECGIEEHSSACPYDLSVIDESVLAKRFINRYPKSFAGAPAMQTQLLSIPQTRTIEIHSGPAVPGQPGQ